MQGLTYILILCLVSPCLCLSWNVMDYGARADGKSDDSEAFLNAWNGACGAEGTSSTLVIPATKSFMVTNLKLNGPCKSTSIHIHFEGSIVAPSRDAWEGDKSNWIVISKVNRLTVDGGGQINGDGSTWWDCGSCDRPSALHFHGCNHLRVSDLSSNNPPQAHISISDCNKAIFSNIKLNAPSDSPNTDGFDISGSTKILIQDSIIATGDDCIAVNTGSSYIHVNRLACGPGHGISIGSLGKDKSYGTVEEVYVQNCTLQDTTNGARIKTFPGGSGYAKKITFEQIKLINVRNPIIIDQHYGGKDTTQTDSASAVQVSDVTYRGFDGTSTSDIAITLDCSTLGCSDLVLDQINIVSSQQGKTTYASCTNGDGLIHSTFPNVPCLREGTRSTPPTNIDPNFYISHGSSLSFSPLSFITVLFIYILFFSVN